jgi:hypothetical protein
LSLRLLSVLLCSAAATAQQVHVVGPPGMPGPHFESVQLAVDTAADGDVITIEPSFYEEAVVLHDRHLVLAGRAGPAGERVLARSLVIEALAPGRSVVVRGLDILVFFMADSLTIEDCEGAVLVEDMLFHPFDVLVPSARIERSGRVVVARSTLRGGRGDIPTLFTATPGRPGLIVADSDVALDDSHVLGGGGLLSATSAVVLVQELP